MPFAMHRTQPVDIGDAVAGQMNRAPDGQREKLIDTITPLRTV